MNMRVVFLDNKEGTVDSMILNQMISWNRIRMFMRSDGWAMVGISPMRGMGGMYEGVDRRGSYGLRAGSEYRIAA